MKDGSGAAEGGWGGGKIKWEEGKGQIRMSHYFIPCDKHCFESCH